MIHYLFYQAGSIPGIPGTFANCRVDVDEDGNITKTPLGMAKEETASQADVNTEVTTSEDVSMATPEPPPIEEAIVTPPLMNGG